MSASAIPAAQQWGAAGEGASLPAVQGSASSRVLGLVLSSISDFIHHRSGEVQGRRFCIFACFYQNLSNLKYFLYIRPGFREKGEYL